MKKSTHWMGVFATGLISAIGLAGCSSTPDDPGMNMPGGGTGGTGGTGTGVQLNPPLSYTILSATDAPAGPTPAPATWGAKGCSTCHGTHGQGFPNLAPEVRHTPTAYATWMIRTGRGGMAAVPAMSADPKVIALSDPEMMKIITWLQGQPKPTTPDGLYKDFCGNCHGPAMGNGGAIPVNITGKLTTEVMQRVRMGEGTDPSMRSGYMPANSPAELTDAELQQIATFLGSK